MDMPSLDLDLDLIRCFVAVAECGGFTAAGKRLHLTQSAVSLKIQRLEALLNRRIFTRTSRSLELTTEGELLWSYAGRLLALSEEMLERVTAPVVTGALNLGVAEYFVPHLLPNLLSRYAKAHPDVLLNVEVGLSRHLFHELEEGRLDLIIASSGNEQSGNGKDQSLHRRTLLHEPFVWVKSESLELPKDGEPLPLALLPLPCRYRLLSIDALERVGRPWRLVYSSASLASILASVRAGLAITAVSRSTVLPGMVILTEEEGFPALPDIEVAIISKQPLDKPLTRCLSEFFFEAVEECKEQRQTGASFMVANLAKGELRKGHSQVK